MHDREMRCAAGLLVVAVGLAACGGDDGPTVRTAISGERIKITWFEYDEGSREPYGLRDGARDEVCVPQLWADGLVRCTPWASTLGPPTQFADDACTDPVHQNLAGDYAAEMVDAGGEPAIAVLRDVEPLMVFQWWSRDASGACVGPMSGPSQFGRVGAEVPSSAFVVIDRVVPVTAGRITVAVDTTVDGLYFPTHARDTELGFDCVLAPSAPDAVSCLPNRYTITYRDAECTQPVVQALLDGDLPRFIGSDRGCEHKLYEVGPTSSEGARFWLGLDGTCAPLMTSNQRWYELTPREAAVMERRRVASGRRLAPIALISGEHGLIDRWWYDEELGDECTLNGLMHCRPDGIAYARSYFADASCAQPLELAIVRSWERPCNVDPAPVLTGGSDGIHRIGARFTGTAWRRDPISGLCVDTPRPDLAPGYELYTLGELVGAEPFLGGNLVTD